MTEGNKTPGGPIKYPIIGNLLSFASPNRLEWLQSLSDKYGPVARFQILKKEAYLINHPELVKEILTKKMPIYSKNNFGFRVIKKVLGESIFTTMGEEWRRKRRLAQPNFHKATIAQLGKIMTDTIQEMLDSWEEKCKNQEVLDINDAMMRLTLNVVVKTLFHTDLSKEEVQTVADVFTPILTGTNQRVLYPFKILHKIPTKQNKLYKENIDKLDQIIFNIIQKRKAADNQPQDLLQMLMDARDEETGQPLSDKELRDEIMTIFIAGHETTANAMSWLWVVLDKNSAIRNKIEEEVASTLNGRQPEAKDFPNLTYCSNVFKEIMRLYPPVPVIPRRVEKDNVLGDFFIKAGNDVFISPYLLHRHPDFWTNPEVFDPTRFEKNAPRKIHPFAYLPFGGGPRICMGNNFAMMEAVFIVAMTAQRFRLKLLNPHKIKPSFTLTYRPKNVKVHLEKI